MTKSETLFKLEKTLKSARVLSQVSVKYEELADAERIVTSVLQSFPGVSNFAVRSSFSGEDLKLSSQAGRFQTFLNVSKDNLIESIKKVFASYPLITEREIVFIQPYLRDTVRSGVVFSHSPSSGQRYLIDNFILGSDTGVITSGSRHGFKHVCFRSSPNNCEDKTCTALKSVIMECEECLDYEHMDIEYALGSDGELYIFQVRPLVITDAHFDEIKKSLEESFEFIQSKSKEHPFLSGSTTVFGVMPDWNPAEMIGRRPKKLAISLYRELITDQIWAYQRDNYGYKSLRSFPLLVEIGNQPFIDVRVSFNSLLPKGLPTLLENQLVDYYIAKLKENRNYHDKIEFEIVLSSWTLDLNSKLEDLPDVISKENRELLKQTLIKLTKDVIQGDHLFSDIERVKKLIDRKKSIEAGMKNNVSELYWLLEDCKRWGTLPFAGLARAAFIATQILKSIEIETGHHGILAHFTKSANTVASQMAEDLYSLTHEDFLDRYGHLRPGTYDILSRTYREAFQAYFADLPKKRNEKALEIEHEEIDLQLLLEDTGMRSILGVEPSKFLEFARTAIYWREQAKFEFTKNLSGVLDLVRIIGEDFKISREDLAFLDIKVLIEAYSRGVELEQTMRESIEKGKLDFIRATAMELPSLIVTPEEIFSFTEEDSSPNFITNFSVTGVPKFTLEKLAGSIAVIEGADPGYDWIFQQGIAGLITAYGGANSHMAVRCYELGIPAAIGVGERKFAEIKNALYVNLDCSNRVIEYR